MAVFLVFLVHYSTLVHPWVAGTVSEAVAVAIHRTGNIGVIVFFVLSGYLIYASLIERRQDFFPYLGRRIVRIYPAFAVVFLLYLSLSLVFPAESRIPPDPWHAAIYLAQNFVLLPGMFAIEPMITVAWSLSFEFFYYLMLPVLIGMLSMRRWSRAARIGFFVAVGATGLWFQAQLGDRLPLVFFVVGILVFDASRLAGRQLVDRRLQLFALIVVLVGPQLRANGWLANSVVMATQFVGLWIFCYGALHATAGWTHTFLCWAPLRWLGNISYSYYLVHGLALKAAFMLLTRWSPPVQDAWFYWLLMPAAFLATLPPSLALYLAVERVFSLKQPKAHAAATVTLASAAA